MALQAACSHTLLQHAARLRGRVAKLAAVSLAEAGRIGKTTGQGHVHDGFVGLLEQTLGVLQTHFGIVLLRRFVEIRLKPALQLAHRNAQ